MYSPSRTRPVETQTAPGAKSVCTIAYGRPRVLPLQAVDRRRRGARLLDDDGSGSHARSFGGFAGCVGAAARDRGRIRRSAHLRVAPVDHVLAQVVLFLRPSEEELPRGLRVPWSIAEGAAGATRRPGIEVETGPHRSHQAPRRSRGADHRAGFRKPTTWRTFWPPGSRRSARNRTGEPARQRRKPGLRGGVVPRRTELPATPGRKC